MATANVPAYKFYETEEVGYLPDTLLETVSKKLPTSDYIRLGSYLGLRMSDMEYLKCERNVLTQAREMLMVWYRNTKSGQKWEVLKEALHECHRNDLVLFTHDFQQLYNMHDHYAVPTEMWKVERFLSLLSDQIPMDWKDIAIELRLTMSEIAAICQPVPSDRTLKNPVYEVLKAWKYNLTSPPENLIRVLTFDMGRHDVAIFVEGLTAAVPTQIKLNNNTTPLITLV